MEPNELNPENLKKMDIDHYVPGATYPMEVTIIKNPSSFYVRSPSLSSLATLLEAPGDPISCEEVEIGRHVVYKSDILGKYVRGVIDDGSLEDENTTCNIHAIDYGCIDVEIPLKDIKLPKTSLNIKYPAMALHCGLYLCYPKGDEFGEDAVYYTKSFIGLHNPINMIVRSRMMEKLFVDIQFPEWPYNLSSFLANMECSQRSQPEDPAYKHRFVTYYCRQWGTRPYVRQ